MAVRFSVEAIAGIPASSLPWNSDALLVLVQGGRGALRWVAQTGAPDEKISTALLLNDAPLIVAQYREDWCPTCERLLALGVGRDAVDPEALEVIRSASMPSDRPLSEVVDDVSPLLQLLSDGIYAVSFVDHYPTDGQGGAFWSLTQDLQPRAASPDDLYLPKTYGLVPGFPKFLLPTQTLSNCNWDTVAQYRRQIRDGQSLGGIAYWHRGFLSALLDGHHRATASLLEGTPLRCLTIVRQDGFTIAGGKKRLSIGKASVPFEALPLAAIRLLERRNVETRPAADIPPALHREPAADLHWRQLAAAADAFPDVEGVAACQLVGTPTDEHIRSLLERKRHRGEGEVWLLLRALIASRDRRALEVALSVAGRPWPILLREMAFRYLRTQRGPQVEKLFIDFFVNDEGLKEPTLDKIATEYLSKV